MPNVYFIVLILVIYSWASYLLSLSLFIFYRTALRNTIIGLLRNTISIILRIFYDVMSNLLRNTSLSSLKW